MVEFYLRRLKDFILKRKGKRKSKENKRDFEILTIISKARLFSREFPKKIHNNH